jgi:hypothetical protein
MTMTAKNLSTVATDIVETYGKTVINAIATYRVGSERLIDFVDHRVAAPAVGGASRLGDGLRINMIDARQRVRSVYLQGVATSATRANELVTTAVRVASKGIERFAAYADRVGATPMRSPIDILARAALPVAHRFSELAGRVENGSDRLVRRVAEGSKAVERPIVVRKAATRTQVVAGKRKVAAQLPKGRQAKSTARSSARTKRAAR